MLKKSTKTVDKMKERLLCNPKIKMMAFNFPQDTNVICSLSDILEENVDQKYFLSEKAIATLIKAENDPKTGYGLSGLMQITTKEQTGKEQ